MRSFPGRIFGCTGAGAADGYARAMSAKCLRNTVADTAGAADHEHLLAAKIEFVHRRPSRTVCAKNIAADALDKKRMGPGSAVQRDRTMLRIARTGRCYASPGPDDATH